MLIPAQVEQENRKMFIFLFAMMVAVQFGFQAWQMLITNFAVEEAGFNGFQIGLSQSARELPGLLSFLVVYLLAVIKEHRLANFFALVLGIGVFFTGFFPTFKGILTTTFIMSAGFHFYDTLSQSLVLQYFPVRTAPVILGRLRGLAAMSSIAVAAIILFASSVMRYRSEFIMIGVMVIIIALICFRMDPARSDLPRQARSLNFNKNYWLYYVMTVLSGGRRQIFFVFALFLLVKKFNFTLTQIILLFLVNSIVNFIMNPLIGKSINRFGERAIATAEYSAVIVIFSVYAFTLSPVIAVIAYIADQFAMNLFIAERTFFQKISEPQDIAPGTAVGFALNHIAAVIIPVICGMLWIINYRIAFLAGILIAAANLFFIQKIPGELQKAGVRKGILK